MVDVQQHYFGAVPVTEFWNNEEQQGDFEQQISLIDAYNVLMSDRVNDKEQLVDAILKIKRRKPRKRTSRKRKRLSVIRLHSVCRWARM